MRSGCCLVGRPRHNKVVNRCRAADMGMGDEPELTECRQCAIDRGPVNTWRRCLGPSDDLIGGEVLVGAVEDLDDGLASPAHALVLVPQQAQRSLDARRGRRFA